MRFFFIDLIALNAEPGALFDCTGAFVRLSSGLGLPAGRTGSALGIGGDGFWLGLSANRASRAVGAGPGWLGFRVVGDIVDWLQSKAPGMVASPWATG